jgi:segregation and condensation protein B
LAQLANLTDGTEARTLLDALRQRYDERGCAFQITQVAGGYQLLSRPKFAQWLRPQAGAEQEIRLSPPALETLAVVAHRQPVLRAEVEAIRGVACGEILRQLMERDLLRIVGRSEELGRPLRYGTTKRFLQVFGLKNLEQLPLAAELRQMSMAGESAATTSGSSSASVDGLIGAGLTDDVDTA